MPLEVSWPDDDSLQTVHCEKPFEPQKLRVLRRLVDDSDGRKRSLSACEDPLLDKHVRDPLLERAHIRERRSHPIHHRTAGRARAPRSASRPPAFVLISIGSNRSVET